MMSYAKNVIKTRGYELVNPRTKKAVLDYGKPIQLNHPVDFIFEKKDMAYLLKFLFERNHFGNKLLNYDDVKKWGWNICEGSMAPYKNWFSGQQVYYYLHHDSRPIRASHFPIIELPPGHKIRMKIKERLIRLEGKNAGKYGCGSWRSLDTGVAIKEKRFRRRRLLQIMRTQSRRKE